jgi:SAM-dependent methyltransferase
MPEYPDLPTILMHPHPELVIRRVIDLFAGLEEIDSVLDVGSGHGGVFDYDYWRRADLSRRATCDIHSVREMSEEWETQSGVDVEQLSDTYPPASFDYVQCMEVLEHVPDSRTALEQLNLVARKLVVITSADELHHGYDSFGNFDETSEQARIERINPHQRYIRQPRVSDLRDLGFAVFVERTARRQLIAWKAIGGSS